jgi:hypothetical protein
LAEELNKPNEQSELRNPASPTRLRPRRRTPDELRPSRPSSRGAGRPGRGPGAAHREGRPHRRPGGRARPAPQERPAAPLGPTWSSRQGSQPPPSQVPGGRQGREPCPPAEAITGRTIDEIDASLATAQAIAGASRPTWRPRPSTPGSRRSAHQGPQPGRPHPHGEDQARPISNEKGGTS